MNPKTNNVVRRLDDKHRYKLIEQQNRLLMVACVLLAVIMSVLAYRAVKNYFDVQNCIHQDINYFVSHKCGSVLSIE